MIDPEFISPSHAIQLTTGELIVGDKQHFIVKMDVRGIPLHREPSKLENKPLKKPQYLIGCSIGCVEDCILVADQNNDRIVLLNCDLDLIKELVLPEHGLQKPFRMCLDNSGVRLFVAEQATKKKLKIFTFSSNA